MNTIKQTLNLKILVNIVDSPGLNLLYLNSSKLEQVHKQSDLQDYDIFGLESDFKVVTNILYHYIIQYYWIYLPINFFIYIYICLPFIIFILRHLKFEKLNILFLN